MNKTMSKEELKEFSRKMISLRQASRGARSGEAYAEAVANTTRVFDSLVDVRSSSITGVNPGLLKEVKVVQLTGTMFHIVRRVPGEKFLYEYYHDFKTGERYIKKSGNELVINRANYDAVLGNNNQVSKALIDTEVGRRFKAITNTLGCLGNEQSVKVGRALVRLDIIPCLEIMASGYQGDNPDGFLEAVLRRFNSYDQYRLGPTPEDGWLRNYSDDLNVNGTKPKDILGVTKGMASLVMQGYLPLGTCLSIRDKASVIGMDLQEANRRLYGLVNLCRSLDKEYGLENLKHILKNCAYDWVFADGGSFRRKDEDIVEVAFTYGVPVANAIEYIYYNVPTKQGWDNYEKSIGLWEDYLKMASDMNVSVPRYPKHLRTDHDKLSSSYEVAVTPEVADSYREAMSEAYELFNGWAPSKRNPFEIVVPTEALQLVDEGAQMSHCVASYVTKVAKGKSIVLFLRNRDNLDKSLVTVEITGTHINHATGKANRDLDKEELAFIEKFAKRHGLTVARRL